MLHGVGAPESPVRVGNAPRGNPEDRFSVVLSNPPFGKKSSFTVVIDSGDEEPC